MSPDGSAVQVIVSSQLSRRCFERYSDISLSDINLTNKIFQVVDTNKMKAN